MILCNKLQRLENLFFGLENSIPPPPPRPLLLLPLFVVDGA